MTAPALGSQMTWARSAPYKEEREVRSRSQEAWEDRGLENVLPTIFIAANEEK